MGGECSNSRLDFINISERFHENYKFNIWLENSNVQCKNFSNSDGVSLHQSTFSFRHFLPKKWKNSRVRVEDKKNFFFYELKSCLALANEMSVVTLYVCVCVKEGHYVKTSIEFTRQPYSFFVNKLCHTTPLLIFH